AICGGGCSCDGAVGRLQSGDIRLYPTALLSTRSHLRCIGHVGGDAWGIDQPCSGLFCIFPRACFCLVWVCVRLAGVERALAEPCLHGERGGNLARCIALGSLVGRAYLWSAADGRCASVPCLLRQLQLSSGLVTGALA